MPRWPEPFWDVLDLLRDFRELGGAASYRGASYRVLARISYEAGFGKTLRSGFYRLAESVPLSEHHANHILDRLQEAGS